MFFSGAFEELVTRILAGSSLPVPQRPFLLPPPAKRFHPAVPLLRGQAHQR